MTGSEKLEPDEGSGTDGAQATPRRLTVDAGSFVISTSRGDVIATGAPVESGVVVCLTNVAAGIAALLHFASPDSKANPNEAASQPARFADTGLELLFEEAGRQGANAGRCTVRLVGAATVPGEAGSEKVAKRNLLAARSALWRRGVLLDGEDVGGTRARRATLTVEGGQLVVELEEGTAEHGGTLEQE
jgi:chemotaxis protein CheD